MRVTAGVNLFQAGRAVFSGVSASRPRLREVASDLDRDVRPAERTRMNSMVPRTWAVERRPAFRDLAVLPARGRAAGHGSALGADSPQGVRRDGHTARRLRPHRRLRRAGEGANPGRAAGILRAGGWPARRQSCVMSERGSRAPAQSIPGRVGRVRIKCVRDARDGAGLEDVDLRTSTRTGGGAGSAHLPGIRTVPQPGDSATMRVCTRHRRLHGCAACPGFTTTLPRGGEGDTIANIARRYEGSCDRGR